MTSGERHGPSPFACAYINGQASLPPVLLPLDGIENVAELLASACVAIKQMPRLNTDTPASSLFQGLALEPSTCYYPDGTEIMAKTPIRDLGAGCVIVLAADEPFDAVSVPERARHVHKTNQEQAQVLGPLVRASEGSTSVVAEAAEKWHRPLPPGSFSSRVYGAHRAGQRTPSPSPRESPLPPWKYSPSGKWEAPLALRPDRY